MRKSFKDFRSKIPTVCEAVLLAREKARREKGGDIQQDQTYIDGENYFFRMQEEFEGKISLPVPDSFVAMPQEMIRQKYPMENRPQVVLTNPDTTINYALNYFPTQPLTNEQVSEATKGFYTILKRMQPGSHFYEQKVQWSENRCCGWFDFKSPGIDQPLYTLMTLTPIEGKVFHSIFNCAAVKMPNWKPVFLQVIHAVEDMTK